MTHRIAAIAAVSVGFFLATVHAAEAEFRICNKTANSVSAAFGYRDKEQWVSQGWWNIDAGACATVLQDDLRYQRYYVYAWNGDGTWSGDFPFCTEKDPFVIVGDTECEKRGYVSVGFREVDVGKALRWTFDLK